MTRTGSALTLLALAAAACNRQAGAPPASVLQTGVAATLTAAPPLPATRTSPPSATPSLTASPVPPSPVPTDTPGATPTVTVPPLATDDPRYGLALNLAVPDYHDGFAQRFTWGELADAGAVNTWEDGHLKTSDLLADGFIWWSGTLPDAGAGDFFAEATANIEACAGKDAAGFAGRIGGVNLNSGYTLEVACDGTYRMRKFSEGAVTILRDWTASDAIVKGPDATNRLGLLAHGDQITPFVNGVALGPAVQDPSFAYGTFGLFAMARETPGVVVNFDDFALWYVRP
jgi:hypothetical protein